MTIQLLTEADLVEVLNVPGDNPIATLRQWRKQYRWPHVKLGREVRFTPTQVESIIASRTVKPKASESKAAATGLTKRSLAKKRGVA